MKKSKRTPEPKVVAAPPRRTLNWWPYAAALAGLFVVFQVYGPALNGAFVLDDRSLPFFAPHISPNISGWLGSLRPLLMVSYWMDYRIIGGETPELHPYVFHATNVWLHFLVSILAALI